MSCQDQPAKRLIDRSILFPRASDDDGTCHPATVSFNGLGSRGTRFDSVETGWPLGHQTA